MVSAAVPLQQHGRAGGQTGRWYKGNTHTHTLNSDGDSTPDDVVRWYREHGYQFLVLTDHNFLTTVDGLNALHGADEKFLVVKGEEVTDRFDDKSLHINGLDVGRRSAAGRHVRRDVLQRNVDAIRAATAFLTSIIPTSAGRSPPTSCAGSQQPAVRDLQRPSAREQRRRRRRARARGGVGRDPHRRARSSTASRWTMRTRSSSRATPTPRARAGLGRESARRGSRRERSSTRWSAATSTHRPVSS